MKKKYTVVIVDDHQGVRSGIAGILEGSGAFCVVGQASDGREALQIVAEHEPDLLILDVKLPKLEGPDVARKLTESDMPTAILALSSYDLPEFVKNMIENGAQGYLTKDQAPRLLIRASLEILEDEHKLWIPQELKQQVNLDEELFGH